MLKKFEGRDQVSEVVAVERAIISKAELFKQNAWPKHALGGFFGFADDSPHFLAAVFLYQLSGASPKMSVHFVGGNLVEVSGNRADVLINRPLVIIEDDDQAFGRTGNVVQCLERNAVGKG